MAGDTETVTVVRLPARNRLGDRGAGDTVTFDIVGCRFAPGPSTEVNYEAQQVRVDATIYAPPGEPASTVQADDRVRVRGDEYEVVGKPQDWGSAGVVIALRLRTG